MVERIDPLFNLPASHKKAQPIKVESSLVSATERPPHSTVSNQPMQLVEGAYGGKTFKLWVDTANRIAIPVRD
jgi:hypothetical protein